MKACGRCGESKPFEDFHKRKDSRDGRVPTCKVCTAERRIRIKLDGSNQTYPELTGNQKKFIYTSAIVRMREMGLTTKKTTIEMLDRVGEM